MNRSYLLISVVLTTCLPLTAEWRGEPAQFTIAQQVVLASTIQANGGAFTPKEDSEAGIKLFTAASRQIGKAYNVMTCDQLVSGASEEAGIRIVTTPFHVGTRTKSWFDHGMGPEFVQIAGGDQGELLFQLTADEVANRIKIPIGSVIVSRGHGVHGHAALFVGESTVGGQTEMLLLDASDAEGWTVSLDGNASKNAPVDKDTMITLPGHQVGYHATRLQWRGDELVKVFQPITIRSTRMMEPNTVALNPGSASAERSASIVAPGNNAHSYNVYRIDTRGFASGGILDIDIKVPPESGTNGSFDLFAPDASLPTHGVPTGTLAHRYDVRKGTSARIEYRFQSGQVFALGLEGNWFSPKGASGVVYFRASVRK